MLRAIIAILVIIFVLFVLMCLFPKPATRFLVFFIGLAICCAVASIQDHKEINHMKENGMCLDATVTKIVSIDDGDDKEYDIYFEYNYNEKSYLFVDRRGSKKFHIGDTVAAYIHPNNPQELYFDEPFSIVWAILILVIGGVAFLAMREMTDEELQNLYIPD